MKDSIRSDRALLSHISTSGVKAGVKYTHLALQINVIPYPALKTKTEISTVEFQWLEHLWDHENWFETGVVRANEGG